MESDNNTITIEKFLGEGSTSNVYLCSYNTKNMRLSFLRTFPSRIPHSFKRQKVLMKYLIQTSQI